MSPAVDAAEGQRCEDSKKRSAVAVRKNRCAHELPRRNKRFYILQVGTLMLILQLVRV
jgi:hypothetical protein